MTCTYAEQHENHEKDPRWSWARKQMGNPSLNILKMKAPPLSFIALICALPFSLHAGPLDSWTICTSGTTNTLLDVTFANGTFVAVGFLGTILTSSDGVSWSRQNSASTNTLAGITFDGRTWVASGFEGTILTSTTLLSWANQNSGTTTNLVRSTYANGILWSWDSKTAPS
jgi:hypothetical protein